MIDLQTQTIKLRSIEQPILDCIVVSKVDVDRMAASDGPLPPVSLARVGRKIYPIRGFAALSAAAIRGDESLHCILATYETKKEAVMAGLRECSISEPINMLKINDIHKFLGEDASVIATKCNLGGTFFEKIARARIIPEVYDRCEAVLEQLSTKLSASMLAFPPHILTGLAKAEPKKQLAVFDSIYEHIEFKSPESQFTWPTPAHISMIVRETSVIEEAEGVIVHAGEFDSDLGSNDSDIGSISPPELKVVESPESLQLAKQSKNGMVLPKKDGSWTVVDTKAKTVADVKLTDDKLNFKSLYISSERAVIIPPSIVKHLDLTNTEAREKKFDSPKDAIKHLKTLQKSAKIAIFWTV